MNYSIDVIFFTSEKLLIKLINIFLWQVESHRSYPAM